MSAGASRWREVARFELQLQAREFLTWVYVAVFFFLCFGYASSGAVELVNGRGAVPRNAPWALAHAMAGVTAFGQVITTMITATAVMRDVATRTQELLFTTRLTRGSYLGGRYLGALGTMALVYLAIPVGLLLGFAMPWVHRAALAPMTAGSFIVPLALLVLPNVLVVSTLFFTAGALRRGFMAILLLGLSLVALWQTGLGLVQGGSPWAGALVDPFGNAALEASTMGWNEAMRSASALPLTGFLLANRAAWGAIAVVAALVLVRRFRFELLVDGRGAMADDASLVRHGGVVPAVRATGSVPPGWWDATLAEGRWILGWTLRERGFATLASIGTLNAAANAWGASATSPTAATILATIQLHSRVLLILIATIYAGELVWRDRDVRAHELRDSLPIATSALVAGRIGGILLAELVIVVPLLACALVIGAVRGAAAVDVWLSVRWIFGLVYPFLAQLTLLSLLIHVLVQNKVAGHVLLIIGWVGAVAMERTVALPAWVRFAEPPAFTYDAARGFGDAAPRLLWSEGWYTSLAIAFAVVAALLWVRGGESSWSARVAALRERLTSAGVVLLCGASLAAAVAATRLANS